VYTLRCTARLIARIPVDRPGLETRTGVTTTRLGDWYATVHTQHRRPWVLAVSERSLLPVLIPLAPAESVPLRLVLAVSDWLRALGVGPSDSLRETDAMSDGLAFGATDNRSIVGGLMLFSSELRIEWADNPTLAPEELVRFLAKSPMKPLGGASPWRRALEVLGGAVAPRWTVH
jgi:hypothetical protein